MAEESKERLRAERGRDVPTEIVAFTEFWRAEDYHQKYGLRGVKELAREFQEIYPDPKAFTDSTAVARANGYVVGNGTPEQLEQEIHRLGLSEDGQEQLREIAERRFQ